LAFSIYKGIFYSVPISLSIFSTASLAPPWYGPHSAVIPAAIHANGLANDDPAILTVEVEAFYSWSACRINIISNAFTMISATSKSSIGFENI
jgi:hypothetical protein